MAAISMSATPSPSQPLSSAAPPTGAATPAESDAPCRVPVVLLFALASLWLVVATLFELVASLKLHAPGFLADHAWFTYGRVQPAAVNALVYGFATQAALGIALFLIARMGRTRLAQPAYIVAGTIFWNVGVKIGVFGILIGDSTGHDWLEMPAYASVILFIAYSIISVCALITFAGRHEKQLYVSQWLLLAALFWFPWIYSTANLLLAFFPVRGVLQAVVDWWYINNLSQIWFGFVGLAAIFFFLPKLTERPLYSRYLAIFAFWTLALFGGWTGIHHGTPLPAWMAGISTVFTVLTVVPLLAIAINFYKTFDGSAARMKQNLPLKFIVFAAGAYVVAGALGILDSLPAVHRVTRLTFFEPGRTQLFLYGFFAMTAFGVIYHVVPQLMREDWPSAKWAAWHFKLAAAGMVLYVVPMVVGGVLQGLALKDNPHEPFMDALQTGLMAFRVATLGEVLIALGNLALVLNLGLMLVRRCRECCVPVLSTAIKPQRTEAAR